MDTDSHASTPWERRHLPGLFQRLNSPARFRRSRACRPRLNIFQSVSTFIRPSNLLLIGLCIFICAGASADTNSISRPQITRLNPPEKEFFEKQISCHGIPIKAPAVVVDEALFIAYDKLSLLLTHLPMVTSNLVANGVELHIIGRDQVTTDLPEWRHDKGKPLAEYKGLTRDQRTRGMGGRLTSCGEENLLKLEKDKYLGRDICIHEFSHAIRNFGSSRDVVARFNEQYRRSLAKGLWKGAYSGTNPDEFFAELTMWYFGTHGDLNMEGEKPANGREGLEKYDPEAFALFDDFYSGRIPVSKITPRPHHANEDE